MPVSAVQKIATGQNGLGSFILQCRRLDFHYCDWAGSSRGMIDFLKHTFPAFAKSNPSIEFHVSPRPRKHPVIRGHFVNGTSRAICVRNMPKDQVLKRAEILRDASGEKVKRETKTVHSTNESVRGIWSPLHDPKNWRM